MDQLVAAAIAEHLLDLLGPVTADPAGVLGGEEAAPSGEAITVSGPFRRIVAPARTAAVPACRMFHSNPESSAAPGQV